MICSLFEPIHVVYKCSQRKMLGLTIKWGEKTIQGSMRIDKSQKIKLFSLKVCVTFQM